MLFLQEICLQWDKEERGVNGENVRRRFPHAYLMEKLPSKNEDGIFVHHLCFYQEQESILDAIQYEQHCSKKYFQTYFVQWGWEPERISQEVQKRIAWIKKFQYACYNTVNAPRIQNLSICEKENKYELSYEHDRGVPIRRGHNKDYQNINSPFYGKDILNETAFVLLPGQYGSVIWNERKTDYDTGAWYYQLHIYNLYYASGETVQKDCFIKRKPDYIYKQLAYLY